MNNPFNILCLATFLFYTTGYAQISPNKKPDLTGNLYADSKILLDEYRDLSPVLNAVNPDDKKSTVLAGVMSAIVPGSGELYVGEYLKAAIFFAVEAALITVAVINDKDGDDLTAEFEAFADEHWSVVKYAEILLQQPGLPEGCEIPPEELINYNDPNLNPWERIISWSQLNHCEGNFSHHLPRHGEQQYYELIGKYTQYSSGWDEFNADTDGFRDVPQIMKNYSVMRGNANDAYNVASKAVIGIYINHLLSAVDAVWSAVNYNKDLAVNMRVRNIEFAGEIELIPTLNIQYSF
ncbi:hypothetical protein ACFLSS_01025 [Bacteroidota bacterium]